MANTARHRPESTRARSRRRGVGRWNPWLAREMEAEEEDGDDLPLPRALARRAVVIQATLLASGLLLAAGSAIRSDYAAADGGSSRRGRDGSQRLRGHHRWACEAAQQTIGDEWRRTSRSPGTIFFFILIANLMNLIPGVAAHQWITRPAAWALISFAIYDFVESAHMVSGTSISSLGRASSRSRSAATTSTCARCSLLRRSGDPAPRAHPHPVGSSVRDMFADHMVVTIFIGLVPLIVPAVFMGLGVMVSVIHPFVFTILSMIYIGQARAEPH